MPLGIDVSHNNGTINWATVAGSGITFAFAKATESIGFVDPGFATNWAAMKNNNILRAAYHFFRPQQQASSQADHFLKVVPSLAPGDLPPILDLETTDGVSGNAILDAVEAWLTQVENALGRTPILYTYPRFWDNFAKSTNPNRFSNHYPLWLAQWTNTLPHKLIGGWTKMTFWQYSDKGQVNGVHGRVDLDRFTGSQAELNQLAGL